MLAVATSPSDPGRRTSSGDGSFRPVMRRSMFGATGGPRERLPPCRLRRLFRSTTPRSRQRGQGRHCSKRGSPAAEVPALRSISAHPNRHPWLEDRPNVHTTKSVLPLGPPLQTCFRPRCDEIRGSRSFKVTRGIGFAALSLGDRRCDGSAPDLAHRLTGGGPTLTHYQGPAPSSCAPC
jgi:hypothetical protein